MMKTDLTFPLFLIGFVYFTVQFCFCCVYSMAREARLMFDSGLISQNQSQFFATQSNHSELHFADNR